MNLKNQIFNISSDKSFENIALETFQYQYHQVNVYREFCDLLKVNPSNVKKVTDIPFLPIQFFKSHQILTKKSTYKTIFTSSGTTGNITSKHYVSDLDIYYKSFTKAFELFFGTPKNINILALLPNYLERKGSSLIYMVDTLIQQSKNSNSGFYLNDISSLIEKLEYLEKAKQKTILLGVSYALLDLVETKQFELKNTIIMETGGMKGRRKEMVKEELQESLKKGFGVASIYSEYGMTE